MTQNSSFQPRLLPKRCAPLVFDRYGCIPRYTPAPDENERQVAIAQELSLVPDIRDVFEHAGIDKDVTDDELRAVDRAVITILDDMGWKEPFFENAIISIALARRLCAGLIAPDDFDTCYYYVAERRCE